MKDIYHFDTKSSMILRMKHFQVSMPHYDAFQAFMIHFKYLPYIRCICDTFWYFSSICNIFDDTNHISSIHNTFKHLRYDTFYTLCQTFIMPSCYQFATFLPLCHQQKGEPFNNASVVNKIKQVSHQFIQAIKEGK